MSTPSVALATAKKRRPWYTSLTTQVMLAMVLGILAGTYIHGYVENPVEVADKFKLCADLFIRTIKMIIAPLIFLTIVTGIAGVGDLKKVGKLGAKTLLYFEVVTTLALALGVVSVLIFQPGVGVDTSHSAVDLTKYAHAEKQSMSDFLMHIVPEDFVGAFTSGNLLQVLFVAVLFGVALGKLGEAGQSMLQGMEKLSKVFFEIVHIILKLAPLGAFGAMAFAIGKFGLSALLPLLKLVLVAIFTLGIFVFGVLGFVAWYYRFNLMALIRYLKDELIIVLGTGSSETVLPVIMEKMQRAGCSRAVTGLVIPTGYSFNLDGSSIYLSICVFFIAQAYNVPISFEQGLGVFLILMVTSKGAAAVTGSAFIVLAATINATHILPLDGLALLLAIDRIMSSVRAVTNLIGNAVACAAIARMEGELDDSVGIITAPFNIPPSENS
jgi:aerobic C4-dicarboxylate transport protein